MYKLREQVNQVTNQKKHLFKNTVVNLISHKIDELDNEFSDMDEQRMFDVEYAHIMTDVNPDLVIEIFNALGKEYSEINKQHRYMEIAEQFYSFVSFDNLWEILVELNNDDFLLAMIIIASEKSQEQSILMIQPIIKHSLKENDIHIKLPVKSVFVAMPFTEETDRIRNSIHSVLNEFGYKAIIIDEKEHINQIVPEIFSEIKSCSFFIGELMGMNPGVYLEVGYAFALEKPAILTCHAKDFDQRHFDVGQINTIKWEGKRDFEDKLRSRIAALLELNEIS
jgi:DNA-binding cell septation regulator SpoVG